jgi:hypothetical protein
MDIKNKMWMNGSLEWFAYIDEDEVFLGSREVPYPLEEGDKWINQYGDNFQVVDGEIRLLGRTEPPERYW